MPAAGESRPGTVPGGSAPPPDLSRSRRRRYHRFMPRAPTAAETIGLMVVVSALLALLAYGWGPVSWGEGALVVFLLPALIGGVATTPLAEGLGGRFSLRRSLLLALISLGFALPLLALWRLLVVLLPATAWPSVTAIVLLAQGPALWFRYMSLYGVSNPSPARTVPPALVQPVLTVLAVAALHGLTWTTLAEAILFLALGWACSVLVLDAADRPLRRAFQVSGVALLRPLLDHVDLRDPDATRQIEAFFAKKTLLADLNVAVVGFGREGAWKATICLPTVHPGPFAAVGASDLPNKLAQGLGAGAGTVFVPHTPCNHDLDLPGEAEVDRVRQAARQILEDLHPTAPTASSPLVSPRPGSLARCQILGGVALVIVTQAPAPTDDIDFSVVGELYRRVWEGPPLTLALIDAHNSYIEDEGDLTYGSPAHHQLLQDVDAAVRLARARSTAG
ncbi:MAG: DUF2070 family protein, partial [Thermoplasmata archaeon]|nr:DUF2070 family protein [Thermoplasmata archaeon]